MTIVGNLGKTKMTVVCPTIIVFIMNFRHDTPGCCMPDFVDFNCLSKPSPPLT